MRSALRIGVAMLLGGIAVHMWLIQGLVAPMVVEGGSMAPALVGAHRQVTCAACGYEFACGEESLPSDARVICSNCGSACDVSQLAPRGGNRLVVDRAAFAIRPPQRWDVVVLEQPDDPRGLCVKRVVGLPGETVELRAGDVFVDGRRAPRTLEQLLAMCVPVHVQRPTTTRSVDERRWTAVNESGFDWLVYRHQQIIAPSGELQPGPIVDDLAYNQNESRVLQPVRDVLLRCRLVASAGVIWLQATDGPLRFTVRLDAASGRGTLRSESNTLRHFLAGPRPLGNEADLVFGLFDGQLLLAVGGRVVLEFAYDRAEGATDDGWASAAPAEPLGIGFEDCDALPTDLQVLRDVHYLPGPRGATKWRLGENEFFVLGDNSSVSVDSRSWLPENPLTGELLVGKVLRQH